MAEAVILEVARTPFGRRGGRFAKFGPIRSWPGCLSGLVKRAGIDSAKIEDVVTGAVTQAGEQGANVGRLGVLLAGFPVTVPAVTLNRMCGSSQQAVHFAAQAIAAGDMKYAIGAGVESMTRVPMFCDIGGGLRKAESGPLRALRPDSPGGKRRTVGRALADLARRGRPVLGRKPSPRQRRGGRRLEPRNSADRRPGPRRQADSS